MQIPESRTRWGTASLAELDDELLAAVPSAERSLARAVQVHTVEVSRGRWVPPAIGSGHRLLIGSGIVFRGVIAGGFATGDLLGQGDLLLARTPPPPSPTGERSTVDWQVLQPMRAAVLDARFAAATARWPTLTWLLMARQAEQAQRTMGRLSLVHRQRAEERLLLVLWDLADRWGKVTVDGVLVPIPLRHHQLAALTASVRPTVTLGMRRLVARHLAERTLRGYVLHGTFDEAWARLAGDATRVAGPAAG